MARADRDSWDLANSVGATATMVAAARAAASRRADPVVSDPFAEPLVRAVGIDLFTRVACGEVDFADIDSGAGFPRMTDTFAARAVFYDRFFADATDAGVRQVVILASGLDARPYRLSWPAGTTVYELDQPEVIEFKTVTLTRLGVVPKADHRAVGVDLRDDWPAALQAAGFDTAEPTAWLAEGVLIGWLPPEAETRLLDDVTELSTEASRFAADFGTVGGLSEAAQQQNRIMTERWREHGLELDIAGLTYPGEHTDVAAHLQAHGWDTTELTLQNLFSAAGLEPLHGYEQDSTAATLSFVRAVQK